jgi:hypothetical protein
MIDVRRSQSGNISSICIAAVSHVLKSILFLHVDGTDKRYLIEVSTREGMSTPAGSILVDVFLRIMKALATKQHVDGTD